MAETHYYRGVFVTFTPETIAGDNVYYCYSCIIVGGELDVASNTIYNAEMILGTWSGSVVVLTPSEKIIVGKGELADLLNGEASKVYGEVNVE